MVFFVKRVWKITFESATPAAEDDFELEFVDAEDIFVERPALKTVVMDMFNKNVKSYDNYHEVRNIKEIISPDLTKVPLDNIVTVLAIDKDNLRFGFLFRVWDELIEVLGLWPDVLVEAVRDSENIFWGALGQMLENPDNWIRVDVVRPL